MIKNHVKKLDLFPQEIQFNLNGEKNHKTLLGAFISLGLIVIMIVFGYLFGKDVIDRNYPNVIKTQKEL